MTAGQTAQQMFEAQFNGRKPQVDTRTPAEVAAGLTAAEALELR